MKNTESSIGKPHSAEYFGETRDYWWNSDFLELMAKRLSLGKCKNILDAGCGIGHWGQILAPHLAKDAHVIGIDRESQWVKKAADRAKQTQHQVKFSYEVGDIMGMPFENDKFDLVTCQTVLIHLKDPKKALQEMLRVLRPGGILLAVEPNNFSNRAMISSLSEHLSVDQICERLKFDLIIERGKQALGLGFNSLGDLIPGYLADLGAEQIQVYLSDKATPIHSPYLSAEQQAYIIQTRDWTKRGFIGWDHDEVFNYYLAGGGKSAEFEYYFSLFAKDNEDILRSIDKNEYHCGGGAVAYLTAAQKPLT